MIELPSFLKNVNIKTETFPEKLPHRTSRGVLWQAAPGKFQLNVPDITRLKVELGNCVSVDPTNGTDWSKINHYFRMLPLAALLYQRGVAAFHAAAVVKDNGAILLAGASGVGKSTLLAALLQRGWKMLADDLSAVELNAEGHPVVLPTYPGNLLWPDALSAFQIEGTNLVYADPNRFLVDWSDHFILESVPLRAIYCIKLKSSGVSEVENISGNQKFSLMGNLSYNTHVAASLFERSSFMRSSAVIIKSTQIKTLLRTRGVWSVNCLSDIIEKEQI